MAGLLDFEDPNVQLGLGLLAAAAPRADNAGIGQRMLEGVNSARQMKMAQTEQQLKQMQLEQAGLGLQANKAWMDFVSKAFPQDGQATQAQPSQPAQTGQLGSGTFGIMPTAAGQPDIPTTQPQQPQQQRSSINPIGMPSDIARMMAMRDPNEYFKLQAGAYTPTEFSKTLMQAGINPGTPQWQQLMNKQIDVKNYIAPASFRGGSFVQLQPNGPLMNLPHVPEGSQAVQNAQGQWAMNPVVGGLASMQAAEQAKTLGKTMGTMNQGVDEAGRPTFFVGLPPGTVGGGQAPTPSTPSSGYAGGSKQSAAQGQLEILQQELRNPNNSPADVASLNREIARLGGASPQAQPVIRPGNAPGFNVSQEALASQGAKRYNDTISQAAESPTRVNVYDNILKLSEGGVKTGPGQQFFNELKGYAANAPILGSVASKWKDDVTGAQELNKFLYQNAQRNWQAAGGTGTDAQLESFSKANPNDKMFPQALQAMAQWGKAGELALQGKANAMQNWKDAQGGNVANQDQFERQWRNNFDPMLYQLKVMPPAQAAAQVAQLKQQNPNAYASLMMKAKALQTIGGL